MSSHREAPEISKDPVRRQHRRLRLRQPRPARHRHDHHQLHPARGPRRRPELLRVRRRRPLRDQHRQRRRRQGRRHLRVPVHDDDHEPEHVPLQHRPDRLARQPELQPAADLRRVTEVRKAAARRRLGQGPARRRRATSACARRRTTRRSPTPAIYDLGDGIKVFAGQRLDGFYVDLGSIFDLAALRPFQNLHLIPTPAAPGVNALRVVQRAHDRDPGADHPPHAATASVPTDPLAPKATIGVWARRTGRRPRSATTTATTRRRPVHAGVPARQPAVQRGHRADGAARTSGTASRRPRHRVRPVRRPARARRAAAGPVPGRVPEPGRATTRTAPTCWRSC